MSKPTPAQQRATQLQRGANATPAQERARVAAKTDPASNNKQRREPATPAVPDAAVPRPIIINPPAGGR